MKTNSLSKLIELDKKLNLLEERGKAIRETINEMRKQQQKDYSIFISMENDPDDDPESVKDSFRKAKEILDFISRSISNWDRSIELKKINYQKIRMSEILASKNNTHTLFLLDKKYGIKEIIISLEGLIAIQTRIVSRLEEIIKIEKFAIRCPNAIQINLN